MHDVRRDHVGEEDENVRYSGPIHGGYDPNWYSNRTLLRRRRKQKKRCIEAIIVPLDWMTLKQLGFHLLNSIFACFIFGLMWIFLVFMIIIAPLLMLVSNEHALYRLAYKIVRFAAEIDIHMYNSISRQGEHIYVPFTSPMELASMIFYFSIIKLILTLLTSVFSLAFITVSLTLVVFSFLPPQLNGPMTISSLGFPSSTVQFLVGSFSMYISLFLISWMAKRACSSIRYACCDGLEIYKYVYGIPIPISQGIPSRLMGFGNGLIV